MTVKEFVERIVGGLTSGRSAVAYPEAEARTMADRLLLDLYGIPNYTYVSDPSKEIPISDESFGEIMSRLMSGEPLQYVTGFEKFCGERFNVGKGVLIPRPETEEMMSLIVFSNNSNRHLKIMDVCTGSGCIAWTLWKFFPHSEVYACDISEEALKYAENQRVTRNKPDTPYSEDEVVFTSPKFYMADVLAPGFFKTDSLAGLMDAKFDIIVSNPPYITEKERGAMRRNVLDFEPSEALFVPDGMPLLFYRRIAEMAAERLNPDGRIYFEVNEMFAQEVSDLLGELGFLQPQVVTDISNRPRFVRAVKF